MKKEYYIFQGDVIAETKQEALLWLRMFKQKNPHTKFIQKMELKDITTTDRFNYLLACI